MASIIPFSSQSGRDPFSLIRRDLSRLFDELWPSPDFLAFSPNQSGFLRPDVDVSETDRELIVQAELPGMDEKDVAVELNNNMLILKGEKKVDRTQEDKNFHMIERRSGSFVRSLQLPFEVDQDNIEAKFTNGVLRVTLPKSQEAQRNIKKIEVHKG